MDFYAAQKIKISTIMDTQDGAQFISNGMEYYLIAKNTLEQLEKC